MQDLSKLIIVSINIFPRVRGFTVQPVCYRPDVVQGCLDTVTSVVITFFPPGLWRDSFSYCNSVFVFITLHILRSRVKIPLDSCFPLSEALTTNSAFPGFSLWSLSQFLSCLSAQILWHTPKSACYCYMLLYTGLKPLCCDLFQSISLVLLFLSSRPVAPLLGFV